MKIKYIVDILIELAIFYVGFRQIQKGEALGFSDQKYTKESIRAFAKPMAIITWLVGVSFGLIFLGQTALFPPKTCIKLMYAGDIAIILVVFLYFFLSKQILVAKKKPMAYTYKKNNRKR